MGPRGRPAGRPPRCPAGVAGGMGHSNWQLAIMVGAHNTFTAYPPLKLWGWICLFVWKCQTKKIPQLISEGIHFFDIRVCRRNGEWYGAHGVVTINASPMAWLMYINRCSGGAVVRLILEKGNAEDCEAFVQFCHSVEQYCPAIKFIGGRFKPTWKRLYNFKSDYILDSEITQIVGSMDKSDNIVRKLIGKICPRLWHKVWGKNYQDSASLILSDFL